MSINAVHTDTAERALQAWALAAGSSDASADGITDGSVDGAGVSAGLAQTAAQLLEAFHGSDVKLPDAANTLPGDTASAAPEANDLSGEITRYSPQALSAQRMAMGLQLAPESAALVEAGEAPRLDMPNRLWDGNVRDAQPSSTLATRHFDVAGRGR